MDAERHHATLLCWGRRGGLARFALDAATAAADNPALDATISVSPQNERFEDVACFGDALHPVSTFASAFGAIAAMPAIHALRRDLCRRVHEDRTASTVTLLSHVFSPFVASISSRRAYATISSCTTLIRIRAIARACCRAGISATSGGPIAS